MYQTYWFLNKFEPNLTVGIILIDKLKDVLIKWPRIKNIIHDNTDTDENYMIMLIIFSWRLSVKILQNMKKLKIHAKIV